MNDISGRQHFMQAVLLFGISCGIVIKRMYVGDAGCHF